MRILFISYFFPPYAHATAVERTVLIIKELERRGHKVAVLTARDYTFVARDYSFLKYISDDLILVKPRAIEPSTFLRGKHIAVSEGKSILRRITWPDSRILWLINALPAGIKLVKFFKPDVIVTIAPPYTDLLLGFFLSSKYRIPHIVDMLDPWSDDLYSMYPEPWQKKLTSFFEGLILQKAKGAIVATYPMKWRLLEKYTFLKPELVENITFGINEEITKSVSPVNYDLPFTLLYLGTLRGSHKNPSIFIEVFSEFARRSGNARLIIVGNTAEEVKRYVMEKMPHNSVEFHSYVKNDEVFKFVNNSHVLWLLISRGPGFELVMPAKTITYLGLKRPILATVPQGWTMEFLKRLGVEVADIDKAEEIKRSLEKLYQDYANRSLKSLQEKTTKEFSYSKIAERYEAFLKSLI
ncbi:MAG: glycosyltransferase [candidate division WOR-3 bacterium]